jgi:hypothetical protein
MPEYLEYATFYQGALRPCVIPVSAISKVNNKHKNRVT